MRNNILSSVLTFFMLCLTINYSEACSPHPGSKVLMSNQFLMAVADRYYANLMQSEIIVEEFSYNWSAKFPNAYTCPDTTTLSAVITLVYPHLYKPLTCEVKVKAIQTSGPIEENGAEVTDLSIEELLKNDYHCKQKQEY